MKIVVVDLSTKQIIGSYEADAPNQAAYGGPWGDAAHTDHIPADVFTNKKAPKIPKIKTSKKKGA